MVKILRSPRLIDPRHQTLATSSRRPKRFHLRWRGSASPHRLPWSRPPAPPRQSTVGSPSGCSGFARSGPWGRRSPSRPTRARARSLTRSFASETWIGHPDVHAAPSQGCSCETAMSIGIRLDRNKEKDGEMVAREFSLLFVALGISRSSV